MPALSEIQHVDVVCQANAGPTSCDMRRENNDKHMFVAIDPTHGPAMRLWRWFGGVASLGRNRPVNETQ